MSDCDNSAEAQNSLTVHRSDDEFYYVDFDPPGMSATATILDGRTIVSAEVECDDTDATISEVEVLDENTTVQSKTIEAYTGIKFRASGFTPTDALAVTTITVTVVLSDGMTKGLDCSLVVI